MIVDARGLLCPQPLIETKKAIDTITEPTEVEVWVDNEIAVCNVEEYLLQLGITAKTDGFKVSFTTGAIDTSSSNTACPAVPGGADYAVVVNTLTMGRGSDELGAILLKAFFSTLPQTDRLPSHLLFYNEGVKCTVDDSPVIDAIRTMEEKGVAVIICGTCIDYYALKEQISVGVISNMYKIVEVLQSSTKVVYL